MGSSSITTSDTPTPRHLAAINPIRLTVSASLHSATRTRKRSQGSRRRWLFQVPPITLRDCVTLRCWEVLVGRRDSVWTGTHLLDNLINQPKQRLHCLMVISEIHLQRMNSLPADNTNRIQHLL